MNLRDPVRPAEPASQRHREIIPQIFQTAGTDETAKRERTGWDENEDGGTWAVQTLRPVIGAQNGGHEKTFAAYFTKYPS